MSFTKQTLSNGTLLINNLTVIDGSFITLSIPSSVTQTIMVPNSGSITIFASPNYNPEYSTTFYGDNPSLEFYGGASGIGSFKLGANTTAIFYVDKAFTGPTYTYTGVNVPQVPFRTLSVRLFSPQKVTTDDTNYITNTTYAFSPTLQTNPSYGYTYYYPVSGGLNSDPRSITASMSQQTNVNGANIAKNDVVACPLTAGATRQRCSGNPSFAAHPNARDQRSPDYPSASFATSTVTTATTQSQTLLCLEMHGTYIALRTLAGNYIHLLPSSQANGSTYSGQIESASDYVLTFSNLPSALHTAQWSIYTKPSSTAVVLINRASKTALTMQNSQPQMVSTTYYGIGSGAYNWVYSDSAGLYYDEFTTTYLQSWDNYFQYFFRLLGNTAPEDAMNSSNCIFNLNVITQTTCDIRNPNAICQNTNNYKNDVPSAFVNLCGGTGMMSTINCQNWALGVGNADAQSVVAAYCAANPSDTVLCGCINLFEVRELQDLLSYNEPPIILNPNCNVPTCLPNKSYRSPSLIANTCMIQVCNQTLSVLGSIIGSDVAFKATCNFSATTGGGTVAAATGVIAQILIELQAYAISTYNSGVKYFQDALTHLNLISIIVSITVAIVLVVIMTIVLRLSPFLIPLTLVVISISNYLLFFNK